MSEVTITVSQAGAVLATILPTQLFAGGGTAVPGGPVSSVNGVAPDGAGNVQLGKSNLGLGSVDDTRDSAKQVSGPQATAIAAAQSAAVAAAATDATAKANTAQAAAIAAAAADATAKANAAQSAAVAAAATDATAKANAAQSAAVAAAATDATAKANTAQAASIPLAQKGAAGGVTPLGADSKVPALYLPSYVDDVLEFATLAAFPGAGEAGKIYIAQNTNFQYRWSGSAYAQIVNSPGSSDAVPEGTVNRYFTAAREAAAIQAAATDATGKANAAQSAAITAAAIDATAKASAAQTAAIAAAAEDAEAKASAAAASSVPAATFAAAVRAEVAAMLQEGDNLTISSSGLGAAQELTLSAAAGTAPTAGSSLEVHVHYFTNTGTGPYALPVDRPCDTTKPRMLVMNGVVQPLSESTPAATAFTISAEVGVPAIYPWGALLYRVASADTVPDAYSFTPVTAAALSSTQTSNTITVTGITAASPISISGGTYSVDGGAYTSASGTVTLGQTVSVRVAASAMNSATTTATLSIGGVTAPFSVTTLASADTTPDAFSFAPVIDAALSSTQTSNTITVAGINAPAAISISGGTYSINGGAYTSASGTVTLGQTVSVHLIASASNSTISAATVTIGGVSGSFSVTTLSASSGSIAAYFVPAVDVDPGSTQTSNAVFPGGLSAATPISIAGGTYSINGGPFVSTSGTINPGDRLKLRAVAPSTNATTGACTVTLGSRTATYRIRTSPLLEFKPALNQTLNTWSTYSLGSGSAAGSNPYTVSGIAVDTDISVSGNAEYAVDYEVPGVMSYSVNGGSYVQTVGVVQNGDVIRLRMTAPGSGSTITPGATQMGRLSVGGYSTTWRVSSAPGATGLQLFSFAPVTNATQGSEVISAPVTISGLTGSASIYIAGGAYSLDGGAYTTATGTVTAGQVLRVKLLAASRAGQTESAQVSIGTGSLGSNAGAWYRASFDVTTAGAGASPTPFAFADIANQPDLTAQVSGPITIAGLSGPAPIGIGGLAGPRGRPFGTVPGKLSPGQIVRVRQRNPATNSTLQAASLTVGGVTADYVTITTGAGGDNTPTIAFVPVTNADPETEYTSAPAVLSSLSAPVGIAVQGGSYSVNGGPFTVEPGIVQSGDSIRLRITSASEAAVTKSVRANIASSIGDPVPEFAVTTARDKPLAPATINCAAYGKLDIPETTVTTEIRRGPVPAVSNYPTDYPFDVMPNASGYSYASRYFYVAQPGGVVTEGGAAAAAGELVFYVPVNARARTSSGTARPRSEFREQLILGSSGAGSNWAVWSGSSYPGVHTQDGIFRVTELPEAIPFGSQTCGNMPRPTTTVAQIHGLDEPDPVQLTYSHGYSGAGQVCSKTNFRLTWRIQKNRQVNSTETTVPTVEIPLGERAGYRIQLDNGVLKTFIVYPLPATPTNTYPFGAPPENIVASPEYPFSNYLAGFYFKFGNYLQIDETTYNADASDNQAPVVIISNNRGAAEVIYSVLNTTHVG